MIAVFLFAIGAAALIVLFYSVFCYAPSEESNREEMEERN